MEEMIRRFFQLGEIYQRLVDIRMRKDPERKRDLVIARRLLSQELGALESYVRENRGVIENATIEQDFRKRLSRLRSTIAYHQASWPAVRIDEDPGGYRITSIEFSDVFREFLEWGKRSIMVRQY
tara:strand:+ start:1153 stop:1527 length:375 start_codon:yes stop_codon:yes gene_type:complete